MAQATIGSLSVRMGIDSAAFNKGITELQRKTRGLERSLQRTARRMQRIGTQMSIGLTAPLAAIGVQAVRTAGDYREALAQVEAGLASMGNASGRTIDQLKRQADELQSSSLFTKQDILNGVTSNLLTFGNVAGEQFDRAQQAALDLSARLEQDLKSSTVMIGKALNDPVAGITAMSRAGIQFTEDQKDMIKGMVEMGDTAGAQSLILAELERQFAGSAQAAQDAAPGDEVMDPWNDFKILLGNIIYKVLPPLTEALGRALEWFNKLDAGVQRNIILAAALVAALGPVIATLGTLLGVFGPIIAAITTIAGAGGFSAVAVSLAATLGPFAAVLAAVVALTTAYGLLYRSQREANVARREFLDLLEQSAELNDRGRAMTLAQAQANLAEAESIRERTRARIAELQVELQRRRELAERKSNRSGGRLGNIGGATTAAGVMQAEMDLRAANESLELNAEKTREILANIEELANQPLAGGSGFNMPSTGGGDAATATAIAAENQAREERLDLYVREYEAEQDRIDRLERLRAAHEASIEAIRKEVEVNHAVAEAYKVSRKEGELVARTYALMAQNARLSQSAARALAEELIASEDAVNASMKTVQDQAVKTGDTMADAFKKGADSFTSLISAIQSGDLGSILEGIAGVAAQIFGGGGSSSGGGGGTSAGNILGSIKSFLGFEGGGHTGGGPRSGGIDGRGGFMAMLHPNETVIDHTRRAPTLSGGAMPPVRIAVQANDYFDAKVVSTSSAVTDARAPAIAQGSVARASRTAQKRGGRRL
jgi:uncharacterized protein YfkK (UPF0435 family)